MGGLNTFITPIGDFDRLVDIQVLVLSADNYGGQTGSWSTASVNVWAKIKPVSPRRLLEAGVEHQGTGYEVELHKNVYTFTNITQVRFVYGALNLKIHSRIDVDER